MATDTKTKDIQPNGLVFGDWKLVPVDRLNWELCHRHVTGAGKNEGEVKWHRMGRFYSYGTFGQALAYAADVELMQRCKDEALAILEALEYHRATLERLTLELREEMDKSKEIMQ